MSGLRVERPGMLSLILDEGRYGYHHLGLTTAGPLDSLAFYWANRLVGNTDNKTSIEISLGGLKLSSTITSSFAITGAETPCRLNNEPIEQWRTYVIQPGDTIEIGYCHRD